MYATDTLQSLRMKVRAPDCAEVARHAQPLLIAMRLQAFCKHRASAAMSLCSA
jgi:hypothetical protein